MYIIALSGVTASLAHTSCVCMVSLKPVSAHTARVGSFSALGRGGEGGGGSLSKFDIKSTGKLLTKSPDFCFYMLISSSRFEKAIVPVDR